MLIITLLICSCPSTPPAKPFTVDFKAVATRHEIGKIEAYFEKLISFGGVNKETITVYYYPADDAICLEYRYQFVDYCQFWSMSGREAFVSALARYEEEYEQRTLAKSNMKTKAVYGSVQGFVTWRRTKISATAYGSPKISLGYQFKDNAVFFSTVQPETTYQDKDGRELNQTSATVWIFYTKAQAESLAALFNQDYLQNLRPTGTTGSTEDRLDTYTEIEPYTEVDAETETYMDADVNTETEADVELDSSQPVD